MASEWPNREVFEGDPGAIVWCEAEAAQAINMERAVNWGLPLDMIYSPLSPTDDFRLNSPLHREALLHKAALPEVKFIVVDSLRGSMEGDENSSETIECVKWLAEVARDFNKVVVLLHHLRKRTMLDDGNGVDMSRVRGSSAILQPARMVWALDQPDPFAKDWKRLSVIKSNLAAFPEPLGVSVTDKGVLFGLSPAAPKTETLLDRAVDLLKMFLEHEPKKYIEVQEQCDQAGISRSTMNRAKDKLGINPVKTSTGWMWSLPPHTYIKS